MLDPEGNVLRSELMAVFARGVDEPLSDPAFDRFARRIFAYQFERNTPYAGYCRRRGRTPETISHWTEIPGVPTAAFREVALASGPPGEAEAVFRTSGTTRGRARRGEHYILDLSLYHASLLPSFAAYVLPDAVELPLLSLVPPPAQMVDSSLGHMVAVLLDRLGAQQSAHYAAVGSGIDDEALGRALRRSEEDGAPVCLLGTAFAFVHYLDRLRARGERYRLPAGSRVVDTGGFKGRSRTVPEEELRTAYGEWLGIREDHCVNEYGMTELCSQFYDSTLRERVMGRDPLPRRKLGPPWVRTQVVDPETLEPVRSRETEGILRHYDLANLGSVLAVQTEDLGRSVEDGFVLVGRLPGAPARGCSIAMDLLLDAAREERP